MTLSQRITAAWHTLVRGLPQRVPQVPAAYNRTGLADTQGDYEQMLRAFHGWVYKAANQRSLDVAGITRMVAYRTGEDEYEAAPQKHPLVQLLEQPNPFESGMQFFWRAQLMADLTGNSYLLQVPNALGLTAELWVLDPRGVTIVPDDRNVIREYVYRMGTEKIRLDPRHVIHLKYPNPQSWYYGASPLMAAAWDVDIDTAAKEHQRNFFRHNPAPRVAVEAEGFLDPSAVERIRRTVVARMRDPEHAGEPFIGHMGAKFKELSLTPQEVNYLATRENAREEILSVYGVPASIYGISKDVNRAVAEANYYVYAKHKLEPLATLWDHVLTTELAREYDSELSVRHRSTIPKDRTAEREDMRTRIESGVTSINEERARITLDPVKGGEEPMIGVGKIPLSQAGTDPLPGAGDDDDDDADDEKSMRDAETRSVRAAEWRKALALQMPHEKRIQQRMRAFYRSQAVAVLKVLSKGFAGAVSREGPPATIDEQAIALTIEEFDEPLRELGIRELMLTMPAAWAYAMEQIEVTDNQFRMSRNTVERVMQDSIEKIVGTNKTTKDSILRTLRVGLAENESTDQLRDRVLDVFDEADKVRATAIAQTTATQAVNSSMQFAWEDEPDLVDEKEWLSSRDGRVRDPHAKADGQRVKLKEAFAVGGELLMWPGDPKGSAKNVIRCRCFMKAVMK